MEKVIVSDAPHIRGKRTTRGIMLDVVISLIPATIMGCVFFGWKALLVLAISVLSAVATEVVYSLCLKQNFKRIMKNFDFTSVVTGLLLGLTLPSTVPWYVPMLASIFAIAVVKMLFGGTGKNIVNPAITGRIFAFMAFQAVMIGGWAVPSIAAIFPHSSIVSGATPLTAMLNNGFGAAGVSNLDLFLGTGVMGCIGETCALALLVGGIYLVVRKVINWQLPVIYILVTGFCTVFFNKMDWAAFLPSILSGGLMLGAIFMATDYVTSPSSKVGNYIYFVLLGVITALLRKVTHIEVVSFAILLMNLFVPLINAYIRPRIFGEPSFIAKLKTKHAAKLKAKAEKAAVATTTDKEGK